jgi:hypothetical protein
MSRYAVRLTCQRGCVIRYKRRRIGMLRRLRRWSGPIEEEMGFWTTRFVDARTPGEAAERAVALVRGQLDAISISAGSALEVEIADVGEASASRFRGSGPGFTWFAARADKSSSDGMWEIALESPA